MIMIPEKDPLDKLFHDSLSDQELNPPPGVWDEVRAQVQIDKVFHKALSDHELKPPVRVWKFIQRSIQPRQTSPFTFSRTYSLVASLLLLMGISWWLYTPKENFGLRYTHSPLLSVNIRKQITAARKSSVHKGSKQNEKTISVKENTYASISVPAEPLIEKLPSQTIPDLSLQWVEMNLVDKNNTPVILEDDSHTPKLSQDIKVDYKNLLSTHKDTPKRIVYSGENAGPVMNGSQDSWSVSSVFSPDVNFGGGQNLGSALASANQGRLQYTTGVRVGYSLNNRWSLQSGVQYSDRGNQLIPRGEQDNYVGSNSFARLGEPLEVKSQIIDIPVVVRYKIAGNKLRWYMHSGMSANVTGGASSVLLGAGSEYAPGNHISVSMEPTWRRLIETMPNMKPQSLGVLTGINYKF
jgi:hypothetical protein